MANINIEPVNVRRTLTSADILARTLRGFSDDVESIRGALDYKIAGKEQISKRLAEAVRLIALESERTTTLRTSLEEIIRRYEQSEDANLGRSTAVDANTVSNANSDASSETSDTKWGELLDFLNVWINYARGSDSSDAVAPFASLVSYIIACQKLKEGSGNVWSGWLDFFGGGLKVNKDLVSLLDKYGNIHFVGGLGVITGCSQVISSFLNDFWDGDKINANFFKNPIELTTGIKDIFYGISDLTFPTSAKHLKMPSGLEDFKADAEIIAPIKSVIDMTLYSIADGIDKFKDGTDAGEFSQWLLGTGVTGAESLISSWTLGFVNLDTNHVMDNFSDSISYTQNVLKNLDIPDAAKVALAIPASVPTAAWAMGKSIFDFGWQIGEDISSGLRRLFNK